MVAIENSYNVTFVIDRMFGYGILVDTEDGVITSVKNDHEYNGDLTKKLVGMNVVSARTWIKKNLHKSWLKPVDICIKGQRLDGLYNELNNCEIFLSKVERSEYSLAVAEASKYSTSYRYNEQNSDFQIKKRLADEALEKVIAKKTKLPVRIQELKASIKNYEESIAAFKEDLKNKIGWE